MKYRSLRLRPLTFAIAGIVVAANLSVLNSAQSHVVDGIGPTIATVDHTAQAKYIVRFKELPLALYNGSVQGLASAPRTAEPGKRAKLDTHSPAALAYVSYLKSVQAQHVGTMSAVLGRSIPVERQMQHALNAIVVTLGADEAKKVAALDGVAAVTADKYEKLQTDIGPGFIGAANVWWGAPAAVDTLFASGFDSDQQYRGEGVVIADIDTGYNSGSPSFAGTDDSGFVFTNPLGSNNYLGLCNPAFPEQPSTIFGVPFAGCNNKVIGAYDFITTFAAGHTYSAEDFQGHGSHTGSTAGGNSRWGTIGAYTARISGVAPHANLIIYYSCSASGCPTSATSGAVDQAIQDSVVDSLNYSISGGEDPWNDPTSLAFLSAADAGIFIAAAAGNTSASVPNAVPGTANHFEPWVTTVAAANHTGGPLGYFLTASGAGAPPPIGMNTAPASTQPSGPIATTMIVSPDFNAANDCAAKPAGTFTGKLAIMKFVSGPCGTNGLALVALNAGASQVLLVNTADDYINAGAAQALPVFTTTSVQGNALATFVSANAGAAANVSFPANARLPVTADSLASFSLLGPATFDVIKPDVQAPGISILAAFNNARTPGAPLGVNNIAFDDGTSMATPHTTGSAALLMGLHPDWTPMEVKSALMMTAKEAGLTKADHATPSDFYDRGSGRIQDDVAAKAGLVLNETGLNFLLADPGQGGDPRTLNLASMQNANCVTVTSPSTSVPNCTFTRKFHSTQGSSVTWSAALTGVVGTVTPSNFSVVAHGTRSVNITVDASAYLSNGSAHFGEVVLTPDNPDLPALHLPIAVGLQPPAMVTSPAELSISIPNAQTTKGVPLVVKNTGGPTLTVTNTNDNTSLVGRYVVLDQPSQGNFGDYSDYRTQTAKGIYMTEDFQTVAPTTDLTKLVFPGFPTTATALAGSAGKKIHFEIYADNAGAPNGNPETLAPSYVWNYVATIGTTAGLSVAGDTIFIDLNAAGATPTALLPGRYWVVVYPELNTTVSAWAWFESETTFGYNAHVASPQGIFGLSATWLDVTDPFYGSTFPGMALHIEGQVACGALWLSTAPPTLSLGGETTATVTVTANSALFPVPGPGTAKGFVCLDSNDASFPVLAVPVTATQN
jgi:hypothetical protein